MKRMAAWLLGLLSIAAALVWLTPAPTYSAGACATYKTFAAGDSVTHTDLNNLQITLGQTNQILSCVDDYSATAAQMKTTVNPWSNYAESLATTGQGEIERLRHMWKGLCNFTHWYSYTDNCDFGPSGRTLHIHATVITTQHLALSIQQTWNAAATVFRPFHLSVINLASDTTSHLFTATLGNALLVAINPSGLVVGNESPTAITNVRKYTVTVTPDSVAAATCATKAITVTGISTADTVFVNPAATTNATSLAQVRVSQANEIIVMYCNPTAGALTPAAGAMEITAIRF